MKRKAAYKLLIFLLYSILSCFGLYFFNKGQDLNFIISSISVFQCLLGLLVLKEYYPLFSLAPLFLILSTVFHFGEAYLLGIGRSDLFYYTNIDLAGDMYTYNLANVFALSVQTSVVTGCCFASRQVKKDSSNEFRSNIGRYLFNSLQNCNSIAYKVGLLSTLIGIVPTVLYNYLMIRQTLNGGSYVGIRESVDIGPLLLFAVFYKVGVISMILGAISDNKKKKAKNILICATLFEVICMLSGNRGKQLCIIMIFIFIYYRFIGKLNWKKIIPLAVAGYVGISFLYFISSNRAYGIGNSFSNFTSVLAGEPVYRLLAEQGSTLNIVSLAFRDVPSYTPVLFGKEYIVSLISVFPNTGGWMGDLIYEIGTLNFLNTSLTLGDSYIAELYLNFWWIGVFFALFIGAFIGKITTRIEFLIAKQNYLLLSCYLILFYKLLWMVRCNFFNFMYDFIWSSVAIIFLTLIINNLQRKKRGIKA